MELLHFVSVVENVLQDVGYYQKINVAMVHFVGMVENIIAVVKTRSSVNLRTLKLIENRERNYLYYGFLCK